MIYLSGPITGDENYMEHFRRVDDYLSKRVCGVINPAKVNAQLPKNMMYENYMKMSIVMLDMCDTICMLDGWKESCGANREYGYALAKGMGVIFEKDLEGME